MSSKEHSPQRRSPSVRPSALALAIERGEWERIALYLLLGVAQAARAAPAAAIDDLIALLADEVANGDR